jgi:hypothetical protein
MVALVNEESVGDFIQNLKANFYATLPNARGCDLDQVVFATQPGAGAGIFTL